MATILKTIPVVLAFLVLSGMSPIEFREKYKDYHRVTKARILSADLSYQVTYFHGRKSYSVYRTKTQWQRNTFICEKVDPRPRAAYVFQAVKAQFFVFGRPLACIEYDGDGQGKPIWVNGAVFQDKPELLKVLLHKEGVPSEL